MVVPKVFGLVVIILSPLPQGDQGELGEKGSVR